MGFIGATEEGSVAIGDKDSGLTTMAFAFVVRFGGFLFIFAFLAIC